MIRYKLTNRMKFMQVKANGGEMLRTREEKNSLLEKENRLLPTIICF